MPPLNIEVADAAHRVQSLWLVFSPLPAEERAAQVASTIAAAKNPVTAFADLLIARRGKRIVAATWVQPAPGRTAIVWPPQLAEGEPEETAALLFAKIEARLDVGDVDLAQAIQISEQGEVSDRLIRHGFQRAAKLLYLACDVEPASMRMTDHPPELTGRGHSQPLEFERFTESQAARLSSLIERTYVETQDIPFLNNLRSMADVLDGYRQTGVFDPANWFFVRKDDEDVGCLLLTDHPSQNQFELVYMGVVPEARGHGLGKRVTDFAKEQTWRRGRRMLVLGVDGDNGPALLCYTSAGFQCCQERWIFLRRCP